MEEVDKEISEMKLSLNARARVVAESYLLAVCLVSLQEETMLISAVSVVHIMIILLSSSMSHAHLVEDIGSPLLPRSGERKYFGNRVRESNHSL